MKLRRRQKRKHDQALDAIASVTKLWSEWQLGKRVAKTAAKTKELRPPSKLKRVLSLTWVKIGGGAAVAGGAAAVVARKLKGSEPDAYTGPPPSAAADAAVPSPDTPAPLTVAPDPATQERDTEPAGGSSALRSNREEPEPVPSAEKPTEHAAEFVESFGGEAATSAEDAEPSAPAEEADAASVEADK